MYKYSIEIVKHIQIECDYLMSSKVGKSLDDLCSDATWSRAVIRSLEIIGEASKKIDEEFKRSHAEISWKEMARMRDKLIHDYFGVDYEIVWDVLQNSIPDLLFQVNNILAE